MHCIESFIFRVQWDHKDSVALLARMVGTEYREFPELRASQAGAGYRAAKATAAEKERLDLRDSMEIRYHGAHLVQHA